jgi:hypothetical protein
MNEVTTQMVARAKHSEMVQQAAEGSEGYTIYVQGWLPQQWSRLKNLIGHPNGQTSAQPEQARAARA